LNKKIAYKILETPLSNPSISIEVNELYDNVEIANELLKP